MNYKLAFLRATTGPCTARLNTGRATTDQLGFTRSFGNLKYVYTPMLTKLLLFSGSKRANSNGITLPCVYVKMVILLMTLIFSEVGLPRVRRDIRISRTNGGIKL